MKVAGMLIAAALAAPAAAGVTPAQTVDGFYRFYQAFHPSDGIPDAAGLAGFTPFLSPSLAKLLAEGTAAQARFSKANKEAPPLLEGDLFSSMFEGATAYRVGLCRIESKKATCPVAFTYDDKYDPPTRWTDTVYLVDTPGGWRIDDIAYGGDWEYANRGRLTGTLRSAIANAGG